MLLSGPKKLIHNSLLVSLGLSAIVSTQTYGADFGIAMPDQLKGEEATYIFSKDKKNTKDNEVDHIMGDREFSQELKKGKRDSFAIQDELPKKAPEVSEKSKYLHSGNDVPFNMEDRPSIIEFKNKEIHKEIYNRSDTSLSLSYFTDDYDVQGRNGVFDRTYNSNGGQRGGFVHFTYDKYLSKGWINTFYGGGLAVGYSRGEGQFSSSSDLNTETEFQLFSVPADIRLGFDLNMSRYFKLSFSGGPSVMGLYQSRNDLPRGSEDKHKRQISFGYFGHAKLQVNLSAMSSGLAFETYSSSDMSNMYINFEARTHTYENFQDEISITGATFGVGFSFEYL